MISRRRVALTNLPPLLAALTGGVIILLATVRFGIGLSPDSVGYLAVSRNLLDGAGFMDWESMPLVVQPPLYPTFLAGALAIWPGSPLHAAALLNAVLVTATLWLAGRLARDAFGLSFGWTLLFLATLGVARPLFVVGVTALSEPLFHFWIAVFLTAGVAWQRNGRFRHLVWLAVAATGAVMTRYIGVTVIAAGVLVVFATAPGAWRAGPRFVNAAIFTVLAGTPFALWLARNHALSGTLMGPRDGSGFTLTQNLVFTAATIACWYIPLKEFAVFAWLKKLYLGATAASASGAATAAAGTGASAGGLAALPPAARGRGRLADLYASPAFAPALFVALYAGLLVYTSSTTGFDQIGDRLLAPLHMPLTLLLFGTLAKRFTARPGERPGFAKRVVPVAVFFLMIAAPGYQVVMWTTTFWRDGTGAGDTLFGSYNTKRWRESPTLAQIRALPPETRLYSNATPAVYQWTGRVALHVSSSDSTDQKTNADGFFAWFPGEAGGGLSPDLWAGERVWRMVARFPDGTLYRMVSDREETETPVR